MTNRLLCALLTLGLTGVWGDEGMWLVNQFPKAAIRQTHGVEVTDSFLERLQLSAVRFNSGGSGSFVSPNGLLFTNHHVGRDCIHKVSTAENNYIANGFYAATQAEEQACPDLEINVVLKIEDVTAQIKSVEKPGMAPSEVFRLRRAAMAAREKECTQATGNRCDVVDLYSGGRYHLYQYKKYTDVRLVFAPEESIAAFGGDPDNFTFPRYCLDFAMFRAYENGKPVRPAHWFRWSRGGARENELAFVVGNPGTTGRSSTLAQLEFSRDVSYPVIHRRLEGLVTALLAFSAQGPEQKRQAGDALLSAQNSLKAYTGFLKGLRDPQLMGRKRDEEQTLRAWVQSDPERQKKYGAVWDRVARAYTSTRSTYLPYTLSTPVLSEYFAIARHVLRYAEEVRKPNDQRLREYRDSALESLRQQIFSPAPIHDELEIAILAQNFRFLSEQLGAGDEVVRAILNGRSPEDAARAYVTGSKLKDLAERKRLTEDAAAVRDSQDGMIRLARALDDRNRTLRKKAEDELEAVLATSAGLLAQARFDRYGDSVYPDATFTLRIAFGPVKGYQVNGTAVPYATRTAGLYQRATGVEPFQLPESWLKAKSRLNPKTPFNFVTTCDTHGGNSGSPTVNARGEIIGILFDGNLESLPNRFVYTDSEARSLHVASQIIVEALRRVYRATALAKELGF